MKNKNNHTTRRPRILGRGNPYKQTKWDQQEFRHHRDASLYSAQPNGVSKSYDRTQRAVQRLSFCLLVIIVLVGLVKLVGGRVSAATPEISSGIMGYCLDDHHDSKAPGASVYAWPCNDSAAQGWTVSGNNIVHNGYCLDVKDSSTNAGAYVVLNDCNNSPGQAWAVAVDGFENINSGLCLNVPNNKGGVQLDIDSCKELTQPNEIWTPTKSDNNIQKNDAQALCDKGEEGEKVACYAAQQWAIWQSGSPSHETLLGNYTDGNAYEEWCADFVSYVYKEAGYPFTQGERNGWDEYDANNIQNMGFIEHSASGYLPKPGDIAFFDYPGGHVEIVAVGGEKPIFIYGDSATIDPSTENGQMAENSLTTDGSLGQVIYYLSPS